MKQKTHLILFIAGLIIPALLLLHCGKSREISNEQVAEELLDFLNKQLPGSQLIVKPENRIVEPIEKKHYRVTFKDFTFKTDLPGMVGLISKLAIKTDDFPRLDSFRVEEAVMIYDVETKDIPEYWLKNMGIDYELPVLPGSNLKKKYQGGAIRKLLVNIGRITHKKTGRKNASSTRALNPYDTTIENVKLGLTVVTKQEDLISVFLEIAKLEDPEIGQEDPDAFMYLFDNDAPEPDLNNTLKKGLAIADVNFRVGRVKVSIEKNGASWIDGAVENVSYSLFIKPDKYGTGFRVGYTLGLKNLGMSMPGKKEVRLLSDLKDFRFDFFIEPITPAATLVGLKMFKTILQLRPIPNNTSTQTILFQAFQLLPELIKSNPLATYSIDPFKHYFGDLKATLNVRLKSLFPPPKPEATIKVDIFKIDEILRKLKEADVFSPSTMKTILQTLEKYTVKEENGDATLTYELKPDFPGKYFLNGNPMMNRLKK